MTSYAVERWNRYLFVSSRFQKACRNISVQNKKPDPLKMQDKVRSRTPEKNSIEAEVNLERNGRETLLFGEKT